MGMVMSKRFLAFLPDTPRSSLVYFCGFQVLRKGPCVVLSHINIATDQGSEDDIVVVPMGKPKCKQQMVFTTSQNDLAVRDVSWFILSRGGQPLTSFDEYFHVL